MRCPWLHGTFCWFCYALSILAPFGRSGFHNASYAAQFGVVSYDWSYAKQLWAQDKPMTCEESLTEQAESVLAEMGPYVKGEQPRLWVYRNTIKALNWFSSVREKLDDPKYSGWFVKFANYSGPQNNGSYNVPACTWEKCSGLYHDQSQTPEYGGGRESESLLQLLRVCVPIRACHPGCHTM